MPSIRFEPGAAPQSGARLATIVIMLSFGVLAGFGLIMILLSSGPGSGRGDFFPSSHAQTNYEPWQVTGDPGEFHMPLVGADGETGASFSTTTKPWDGTPGSPGVESSVDQASDPVGKRTLEKLIKEGYNVGTDLMGELAELDTQPHGRIVDVFPRIDDDLYREDPSGNIVREYQKAIPRPITGGSHDKGPFMRLRMSETSWIAFTNAMRAVSAMTPQQIRDASNGSAYFSSINPPVVEAYRGRVYAAAGRLFALWKQPMDGLGEGAGTLWYGVLARIRPGAAVEGQAKWEEDWVHESIAFCTTDLHPDLMKYALEPTAQLSVDDALAREAVFVGLHGVYLRRVYFREFLQEVAVTLPPEQRGADGKANATRSFQSEALMPLLLTTSVVSVEGSVAPADAKPIDVVASFSERLKPVDPEKKDRFDEAGYYLLLDALNNPAHPLQQNPPTLLNFRKLIEPAMREAYRGGRIQMKGILLDEYFPLLLPPNVSGRRMVYRTFVGDGTRRSDVSTALLWYIDTLEPPVDFAGSPVVNIEGLYYKSQDLIVNENGKTLEVHWPVVLTTKILPAGAFAQAENTEANMLLVWITTAGVALIILALIWITRRDRRQQQRFEQASIQRARSALTRFKEQQQGIEHPGAAAGESDERS